MAVATKKLHELAEVFSGYAFKSKDLGKEGLPVVKIKNVNNKIVSKQCDQFLPNNLVTERLKKYLLQKEDILVAMTGQGSLGRIGKMINQKGQYIVNQRVGIVRSKVEDDSLAEYLFSVLALDEFEQQLYSLGAGAGQPNVSAVDIRNLDIPYPAKSLRKFIAKTRANYDNLIENNNRRIAILEDMAQSLYREWFVNFRYPNHEDNLDADAKPKLIDSPLGQIPEGWEFDKLENMSSMKYGKMSKKDLRCKEGIPIYSGYKITGYYPEANLNESKVIVIARGVGGTGDVKMSPDICWLTNLSIYIMENEDLLKKSYLFYQLKFANLRSLDSGTSISQITIDDLSKYQIIAPPIELQVRFEELCKSFWSQVKVLTKKNENLKKQRDMLLPKLISGQIELKD